jgi:hypothetical protein
MRGVRGSRGNGVVERMSATGSGEEEGGDRSDGEEGGDGSHRARVMVTTGENERVRVSARACRREGIFGKRKNFVP